MKFTKIVIFILISMLLAASYSGAALRKPGINGAAFLKIGVGARMVALGSAVTTIYNDPNMIFWNPAGIQISEGKTQIGFTYNDWIAGLSHSAGVVTHSFGDLGTFGVGFIYMGESDLAADRDIAPPGAEAEQMEPLGTGRYDTYNYYDMALIVAYSKQLTDRFRMGASFKYIRESIDDVNASAIAFDFGAVYDTGFRDLTFGARINNVGSDLKFYAFGAPLPLNFSIGASISIAREENTQFKAFFDLTKPQDSPQLYFVGGEWRLYDRFALRGGYKLNYSGVKDERTRIQQTDEGFSFGGGLDLPISEYKVWLNYAFTSFSIFNNTHRFTLKFEF